MYKGIISLQPNRCVLFRVYYIPDTLLSSSWCTSRMSFLGRIGLDHLQHSIAQSQQLGANTVHKHNSSGCYLS